MAPWAGLPEANSVNGLGGLTCTIAPTDIKGVSGEVSNPEAPESHSHRGLGLPGSAVGEGMPHDTVASTAASVGPSADLACNQFPNCAIGLSQTEIEQVAKDHDIGHIPSRSQAVTVGQFADMAGVCVRTVLYWRKAGFLPRRYRRSRKFVWHIDDVNSWLKTSRRSGAGL